jgi:hypothetical protein
MKNILLVIILFIFFNENLVRAENKYTFAQFGNETLDFFQQPLKWDCTDYLKLGVISAATGLTMFADQPIQRAVQRDGTFNSKGVFNESSQKHFYSVPIVMGRMYGELYSPIIFFSGFAVFSLITDDLWSRKVAYEIGQASLYGGGLTFLLKFAIGRARPYMNEGASTYHPFESILIQDYHSIPGGHTQASLIISTVLARNVKPVWLKALFYVPAALTFVSRIYQNQHWTSDDLFGAAMGFYIANWCVDKHEKIDKSDAKETGQGLMERMQVQPVMGGGFYGLNLNIRLL